MNASPHGTPLPSGSSAPGTTAGVRVIAIGRAGAEMALVLREAGIPGFSFAAVDGDAAAVQTLPFEERLFVGARLTRGFGAGGDPELAKAAADEELPAIRALCQGQSMVFIVAGLGGGSGTGIAPVVARVAREAGASVFAFVTAPFECEGTRRQQQALVGLHRLKTVADGVLCLPNEKMFLCSGDHATLVDAFRASRDYIRDAVLCLWDQLTRPGLLNVSFADVCSVLRGPNLESVFARVEVEGEGRADRALEGLLAHPLLSQGAAFRRAEALLVCFAAGSSLGMNETRSIINELTRQSEGARVVVGASVDDRCGEKLTVTVIASTRQVVLHDSGVEYVGGRAEGKGSELGGGGPGGGGGGGTGGRGAASNGGSGGRDSETGASRGGRRLAPPAPELTPEMADELMHRKGGKGRGGAKKPEQVPLPFEVVTRGRFEKCEPTLRGGNNLDQPTYLRRGVTLN
jgi:cell division protein FtsZ